MISDLPCACVIRTMYCACMSVAKPGYGSVVTLPAFRPSGHVTSKVVGLTSLIATPTDLSCSMTPSRWSGRQSLISSRPRVSAAATMNVPVSIRSGMIVCSAPPSDSTPSIWIVSDPAPLTRAPILFRRSARSTISGSRAALWSVVVPRASVAAIITFSVPVTVTLLKWMSAARKRPSLGARATTLPASSFTSAPNASNPARCKSIGRVPIAQPPGKETFALPKRASSGPSARTDARIVFTSSYGASKSATCAAVILCVLSSGVRTVAPISSSRRRCVMMSRTYGMLWSVTVSGVSSAAAMQGSAEFLAPLIETLPWSGRPPEIRNLSTMRDRVKENCFISHWFHG